jgi:hypothetical protein
VVLFFSLVHELIRDFGKFENNLIKLMKYNMNTIKTLFRFFFFLKEISIGLSRGAVGSNTRKISDKDPLTWEFSAFSQNGEDGILDFLVSKLIKSDKRFVEIGTSNGLANNTAYFALVKKFCGIMVEGNKLHSKLTSIIFKLFNKGIISYNSFVTKENIDNLLKKSPTRNPDIFALDIDGNDYYLAEAILLNEFRPSIFVVEYNSNFGPELSVTIPYTPDFDYSKAHSTRLYYGVSILAWNSLFEKFGYKFITVESNGINAFFVLKDAFQQEFLEGISGVSFLDNKIESQLFEMQWDERFNLISNMPLIHV